MKEKVIFDPNSHIFNTEGRQVDWKLESESYFDPDIEKEKYMENLEKDEYWESPIIKEQYIEKMNKLKESYEDLDKED